MYTVGIVFEFYTVPLIAEWEFTWQMQFNIDKYFILRVGRPKHKLVHLYTLHNQNLSETDSAKYLGLTSYYIGFTMESAH